MSPRGRTALFYLILALTPVVGGLAAGEVLVRLLAPQELSGSWLTYGPRGMIVNKRQTTARHQQGDVVVHHRTNRLHQRGAEPQPGAQPVLVLGDSFTFGWMLEESDTAVGQLQSRIDERFGLRRFQMRNAATAGWGAADYLAYLEAFGEATAPTLVVVFINFDDLDRALRTPLYSVGPDGDALPQDLSGVQSRLKMLIDRVPGYDWLLENSHLIQLIRNAAVRKSRAAKPDEPPISLGNPGSPAPIADERTPLAGTLMARLKDWCEERNIQLLVLTTGWFEITALPWMTQITPIFGHAFVDLSPGVLPAIRSEPAAYQFRSDGHPNPRGAGLIAAAAWPALEKALSEGGR